MTVLMIGLETLDYESGAHETKQANLNHLKELKVKVPVRLLLKLHYAKIMESRLMGELVTDALTRYFEDVTGDTNQSDTVESIAQNTSEPHAEAPTIS